MPFLFILLALKLGLSQEMPPLQFDLIKGDGKMIQIQMTVPSGYHITSHKPESEDLIPMESNAQTMGVKFGNPIYPKPTIEKKEGLEYQLSYYKGVVLLKYPIQSMEKTLSKWGELKLNVDFQACTEKSCFAPTSTAKIFSASEVNSKVRINLGQLSESVGSSSARPISSFSSEVLLSSSSRVESSSSSLKVDLVSVDKEVAASANATKSGNTLFQLLLLAFVGGMILNLMPCVLPVLGLKIFSLVQKKGASRSYLYANAFSFLAGTLISFWVFAGIMVGLKSMGQSVGWGFQFQEPGFVIFMALLVTLFALNLFGKFEVSLGWKAQTKMNEASSQDGLWGAFFNGMFMTLLATPCTAPMLSPAMAYAFSQPSYILFVFMTIVGFGLAFPFMAFSLIPGSLRFFPKPGDWMITLKEVMGFLLLLTLPWLLYIFGSQTGVYSVAVLISILLLVLFLVWFYEKLPWTGLMAEKFWPKPLTLLVMVCLVVSAYVQFLQPAFQEDLTKKNAQIQNFTSKWTSARVQELNTQGKDVFVDFTAEWCVTCKANEKVALSDPRVEALFNSGRYIKLIGDYTKPDSMILAELKKYGKSGVPMYILYKHDGSTHVFPEVITPDLLLEILDK